VSPQSQLAVIPLWLAHLSCFLFLSHSLTLTDVLGVFRYRNTYAKSVALLGAKRIDVRPLITHTFGLDSVLEAFETAEVGKGGAIKVMLHL
jgi:threonine dehydrogenase-like Zn-dependent dehydrogenase